jgi:hypothetical protein
VKVEKEYCFRDLDYNLDHEEKKLNFLHHLMDEMEKKLLRLKGVKVMNYRRLRLDCNEGLEFERLILELRKP